MSLCKPTSTHVDTTSKLSAHDSLSVVDPSLFRGLAGVFQYLTFTRRDISYLVKQICLQMHDPQESHLIALNVETHISLYSEDFTVGSSSYYFFCLLFDVLC